MRAAIQELILDLEHIALIDIWSFLIDLVIRHDADQIGIQGAEGLFFDQLSVDLEDLVLGLIALFIDLLLATFEFQIIGLVFDGDLHGSYIVDAVHVQNTLHIHVGIKDEFVHFALGHAQNIVGLGEAEIDHLRAFFIGILITEYILVGGVQIVVTGLLILDKIIHGQGGVISGFDTFGNRGKLRIRKLGPVGQDDVMDRFFTQSILIQIRRVVLDLLLRQDRIRHSLEHIGQVTGDEELLIIGKVPTVGKLHGTGIVILKRITLVVDAGVGDLGITALRVFDQQIVQLTVFLVDIQRVDEPQVPGGEFPGFSGIAAQGVDGVVALYHTVVVITIRRPVADVDLFTGAILEGGADGGNGVFQTEVLQVPLVGHRILIRHTVGEQGGAKFQRIVHTGVVEGPFLMALDRPMEVWIIFFFFSVIDRKVVQRILDVDRLHVIHREVQHVSIALVGRVGFDFLSILVLLYGLVFLDVGDDRIGDDHQNQGNAKQDQFLAALHNFFLRIQMNTPIPMIASGITMTKMTPPVIATRMELIRFSLENSFGGIYSVDTSSCM